MGLAAIYGFVHERLFSENLWYAEGRAGLLLYASVFWPVAAALVWFAPRWFPAVALGAGIAYAAWWSGLLAPLAVLFFLGSCFFLGRRLAPSAGGIIQTLVGAAVWMTLVWVWIHFPGNSRWNYAVAFVMPYLWLSRSGWPKWYWRCDSRLEAGALALLLFVMGAHFLVALKPEISADGLSMHLALPMAVAHEGRWAFDVQHYSWAVMPAGGDSLYTAAYVLGGSKSGEAAARLLNFAFLAMIVALIVREVRRFASSSVAYLAAALFASTPLVQVITGSLFVENIWAAFVLGAALSAVCGGPAIAGLLIGAACGVKLIAGAFLVPIAIVAVLRKRQGKPLLMGAALAVAAAALPYVYAFAKTGNPVFPFENQIFKSPQFDVNEGFEDQRYKAPRSWMTPYELTFRSTQFIEGQGGAAGFQYFLLALPALLLLRKREHWALAAIALGGALIILIPTPNLRYLYPALPLISILIATLPTARLWVGMIALNFYFQPSSGWYDNEFALFRHDAVRPYVEKMAPVRLLIERLNREAPGEPAAFFSSDATAGLDALAYTDTWHSQIYWNRVRFTTDARQIAEVMSDLGVRHVIAPVSRQGGSAAIHDFLARWLDVDGDAIAGAPLGLFRVRTAPLAIPADTKPFGPGAYDDLIDGIERSGGWIFDRQFPETANSTLTYSNAPGDFLRFQFSGSGITYTFTKTFNRGIAQVLIDGTEHARIDEYAPKTLWQSSVDIRDLAAGVHTFELRVTGDKNARSSDRYVDLDAFRVF